MFTASVTPIITPSVAETGAMTRVPGAVLQHPRYSRRREVVCAGIGTVNGVLSYSVSAAAFPALLALGLDLGFLQTMASFSCGCFGTFVRKTFLDLKWKPRGFAQTALVSFSPFASAPMFTGAHEGCKNVLKYSENISLSIGLFLFIFRVLTYAHNAINLPARLDKIKDDFATGTMCKKAELTLITMNALLYSYVVIDSAYAAPGIILKNWFEVADPSPALLLSFGVLGSVGTFPLALCSFNSGAEILKRMPLLPLILMLLFTFGSSIGGVGAVVARKTPPVNTEIFEFPAEVIMPIAAVSASLYATLLGGLGLESIVMGMYTGVMECGRNLARRMAASATPWFSGCCSRRQPYIIHKIDEGLPL